MITGWIIIEHDGIDNIIPENDTYNHYATAKCKCNPAFDDDLLVHNSFDGREYYETRPLN